MRGPRQYLKYPEEFGAADPPQPKRVPPSQAYKVRAALLQHELARQAIEQMTRLGLDHSTVASSLGVSDEQLRRLLRGESAMTVERMHQLAQAVALRFAIGIERSE